MNQDQRKVILTIVIKRKFLANLEFKLDGHIGVPHKMFRISSYSLFADIDNNTNLSGNLYQGMRSIVVAFSRNPKMFIPFRFTTLKVEFRVPDLPRIMELIATREGVQFPIFTMRRAASIGVRIPELDFSHEYEFRKNMNHYQAFVTHGCSQSENPSLRHMNTFYGVNGEITNHEANLLTIIGSDSNPSNWRSVEGHERWHYSDIHHAQVLHGRVIIANGDFFFTDSSRIPQFRIDTEWPFLIRRNLQGKIETPRATSTLGTENEAIFIGGTNNFMHFVLEDLPRLILADKLGIKGDIPIILRCGLSTQILETISQVSNRQQIFVDTFEEIKVQRLHVFHFMNGLPEAMSGSQIAAENLIDTKLLIEARRRIVNPVQIKSEGRILIIREKGLFRPLVNSNKIRRKLTRDFDFVSAKLGKSNFLDSKTLFQGAGLIIGEYGAGLANMILAKGPTTVIELRGPLEKSALEYQALSIACGFRHIVINGKSRKISRYGIARGPFKISFRLLRNEILSGVDSFL